MGCDAHDPHVQVLSAGSLWDQLCSALLDVRSNVRLHHLQNLPFSTPRGRGCGTGNFAFMGGTGPLREDEACAPPSGGAHLAELLAPTVFSKLSLVVTVVVVVVVFVTVVVLVIRVTCMLCAGTAQSSSSLPDVPVEIAAPVRVVPGFCFSAALISRLSLLDPSIAGGGFSASIGSIALIVFAARCAGSGPLSS